MTTKIATFTPDALIEGSQFPLMSEAAVVASGAGKLVRGTVLGCVTATGKLVKVDSTKNDGSQKPYAILSEDVDASSADVQTSVYLTGCFNSASLVFGGTDTVATHKLAARELGMFFKNVIA